MPRRILLFVAIIQVVLFAAHGFVYKTWAVFRGDGDPLADAGLKAGMLLLSVSFVAATLLAFRSSTFAVRTLYRIAATWLGFFNFFFMAACLCWVVYAVCGVLRLNADRSTIAAAVFGLAVLAGVYGLVNAWWIRVETISVKLPNLPEAWRGRVAALMSDVHLGSVNRARFMRRLIGKLKAHEPDIVFIAGDLYDGTKVDPEAAVAPWKEYAPPFGTYFVTGNHEEFGNSAKYLQAVRMAGMHVLDNEKAVVDGLQIVGVNDRELANAIRLRQLLKSLTVDRNHASILLAHIPSRLPVAEEAGISLQLSGHTHRGQIFPFTWLTHRIFGRYAYGLHRFGTMLVYTSSGAGTWGPPMRVGTQPELVLIRFR